MEEIIKIDLKEEFKRFFRFFPNYKEDQWGIYTDRLIEKFEDPNFRFTFIDTDFVKKLLQECELLNEKKEVNASIVKEMEYLCFKYFDEKNENYLINEGKIQQRPLGSSKPIPYWSTNGEVK